MCQPLALIMYVCASVELDERCHVSFHRGGLPAFVGVLVLVDWWNLPSVLVLLTRSWKCTIPHPPILVVSGMKDHSCMYHASDFFRTLRTPAAHHLHPFIDNSNFNKTRQPPSINLKESKHFLLIERRCSFEWVQSSFPLVNCATIRMSFRGHPCVRYLQQPTIEISWLSQHVDKFIFQTSNVLISVRMEEVLGISGSYILAALSEKYRWIGWLDPSTRWTWCRISHPISRRPRLVSDVSQSSRYLRHNCPWMGEFLIAKRLTPREEHPWDDPIARDDWLYRWTKNESWLHPW